MPARFSPTTLANRPSFRLLLPRGLEDAPAGLPHQNEGDDPHQGQDEGQTRVDQEQDGDLKNEKKDRLDRPRQDVPDSLAETGRVVDDPCQHLADVNPKLKVNADGSVDIYFGPKTPAGKEDNWIQTGPGKGWNTLLRLYGPLQPWFDKTWRPGEIEPVQ